MHTHEFDCHSCNSGIGQDVDKAFVASSVHSNDSYQVGEVAQCRMMTSLEIFSHCPYWHFLTCTEMPDKGDTDSGNLVTVDDLGRNLALSLLNRNGSISVV